MRRRSLRRRIAVAFIALAVSAGVLGGLLAVAFAYTTEDLIFDRLLALEVAHLESAPVDGTALPTPELPFARYYGDAELPAELREPLTAEPDRREVFGSDGRHYHLTRLQRAGDPAVVWVVLEVDDYLVVRPIRGEITTFLGVIVLMITAFAAAVGLFLAHRATGPLRALAREVETVEPGSLPERLAGRYPQDEVGSLADALRAAFWRIRRFIDREQRFTQDASHELRTPLAVIEGSVELLSQNSASDPQIVDRIRSAATAMHLSVDALLALAREVQPETEETSTAVLPIVERTVVNHARLIEEKPVALVIEVDPEWRVKGDTAALQVLVANLVSNAFRYTLEGEIRIAREDDDLVVVDSGVGIDDAIIDDVTKPAVKGAASPGLGLGLSIVERLCERCGWRFEISSSSSGTVARLSLG